MSSSIGRFLRRRDLLKLAERRVDEVMFRADPSDRLLEVIEEVRKSPALFAYAIPIDDGVCYAVMVGCPAPHRLAGSYINADGCAV